MKGKGWGRRSGSESCDEAERSGADERGDIGGDFFLKIIRVAWRAPC